MHFRKSLLLLLAWSPALASAAPLTIDLAKPAPQSATGHGIDFQGAFGAPPDARTAADLARDQQWMQPDFGSALSQMPVHLPDAGPASTLQWAVCSSGSSGFLFYGNWRGGAALTEQAGVQFRINTVAGPLLAPRQPVKIAAGGHGIMPVNMDCAGIHLVFGTAQPLCRLKPSDTETDYFFTSLPGITPDFVFDLDVRRAINGLMGAEAVGDEVRAYQQGINSAFSFLKPDGNTVVFVILTPDQKRHLTRMMFNGKDSIILSNANILPDGNGLRLQSDNASDLALSIFPKIASVKMGGEQVSGKKDWMFTRFTPTGLQQPEAKVTSPLELVVTPQ